MSTHPPFEAVFLTRPDNEPEHITRIFDFEVGEQVTAMRWHPNGRLLLCAVDGDVHAVVMPEHYWDFGE